MDIASLREEYRRSALDETQVDPDPLRQLRHWLDEAVAARAAEPTAMTLATVSADGRPSARTVLLKGLDERGLAFFTHLDSRKARELGANPHAAITLWWQPLERQVLVTGVAARIPSEEADRYFAGRPRESQLGAWASPQSRVISGRAELERAFEQAARLHGDGLVPRPPRWGGFRVRPTAVELWQGRPGRLHDRVRYRLDERGLWVRERLAP